MGEKRMSTNTGQLGVDISINDYHALPHISNSDLTHINKSIEHWLRKNERERSDAMDLGQMFHDLILSPEIFKTNYVEMPSEIKVRRGKEWEKFQDENKGKEVITREENRKLVRMHQSFLEHPKAPLLFETGEAERSFTYEIDEIKCRCRPDFINTKYNIILDLKTTKSAIPDEFARSMAGNRYHVQAAWYLDGVNKCLGTDINKFLFVAVETTSPYSVCIYDLGEESIEEGRRQYKKDLEKVRHYFDNRDKEDYYRGISGDIITLQLPTWAFYKNMELT
jgi:exodeoxyribonuclease VIII